MMSQASISAKPAPNAPPFTAQITRGDAEALGLHEGDTVYVRATRVPPIGRQMPAQVSENQGALSST